MATRAAADGVVTADELEELTLEDVEWQEEAIQREARRIGFCSRTSESRLGDEGLEIAVDHYSRKPTANHR